MKVRLLNPLAAAGLVLLGLALGCSSSSTGADPYNGTVDSSTFAAGFAPVNDRSNCPPGYNGCYVPQQGYAKGQPFYFYNFGSVSSSKLQSAPNVPIAPSNVTTNLYQMNAGCNPGVAGDPLNSPYSFAVQYPIVDTLPLSVSSRAGAQFPLVNVWSVTLAQMETCNDLKMATSVADYLPDGGISTATPGDFGSMATSTGVVELWAAVDVVDPLITKGNLAVAESYAWYKGLQLQSIDEGPVPTDSAGNLVAMDGVKLDPATASGDPAIFSKTTDAKVILLPAVPGDPGFSPIVRLWDAKYTTSQPLGTFTGVCHASQGPCTANQVNVDALITDAGTKWPSSANTIFIVASPQ